MPVRDQPVKDPFGDPGVEYGVIPEEALYGPKSHDLPGQVAGPPPRVVLGSGDWRDVPGLVELGNMDVNRLPAGVPRPVVQREGDKFVVATLPGEIDYNFGKFWDSDTAQAYAARIAHEMDVIDEVDKIMTKDPNNPGLRVSDYAAEVLGYGENPRERVPLKSAQFTGPIGEFPQPMTRKMRNMIRLANLR